MNGAVFLLNYIAVGLFGSILSASFCKIFKTDRNRRIFCFGMAVILLAQGWIYSAWNAEFLRRLYPLVVHLPLMLLLSYMTKKPLWSVISVLSAYLCCELRRWAALLTVALLHGGRQMQAVIELTVTLPLLFVLLKCFTPAVCRLSEQSAKRRCIFGLIPAIYYIFDYSMAVYTDLLYRGGAAAVEFMPFVCCLVYIVFLLYYSAREESELALQQVQKNLNLQLTQAVREIAALRESQTLTSRYRHDLRHHLQYLSACMENGQIKQAQSYISEIYEKIEAQRVHRFCENETANLIISSFAGRAEKAGITLKMAGELPTFMLVSDSDLCVLLSNALENAVNACLPLAAEGKDCVIDIQAYEREKRLFLQVTNPCGQAVRFENGLPVSDREGHGIGVQSICAIVQKYDGVYTFLTKDGSFILRLSV